MAIDRGLGGTACASLGAAGLVFALLPAAWPAPGNAGRFDREVMLPGLRASAAAVDAACASGDEAAFAAATTAAHRRVLVRRLQGFGRPLDASALRELSGANPVDWQQAQPLAGRVQGSRTAVAMPRRAGDGAQVLAFEWNGRCWLLDGSRHAFAVHDAAAAEAAVREAVLSPSQ